MIRELETTAISQAVYALCLQANKTLPDDLKAALISAREAEPWPLAQDTLSLLEDNLCAAAQNDLRNSQAVEGDHLLNIPKDYKAQADAEAKRKAEEEAKKKAEEAAKEAEAKKKAREAAKVPDAPRVPQQPSRYTGRNELSPAEKARLAREERRMQALESPIGFEIQNKD